MHIDQISGFNAPGPRFRFSSRPLSRSPLWLPTEMKTTPQIKSLSLGLSPLEVFRTDSISQARLRFNLLRLNFDFPFWAAYVCRIRDIRDPDRFVPLMLNQYQAKAIDTFIRRRIAGAPGRYVITQSEPRIGLTTAVQSYIFWSQTHRRFGSSYTAVPIDSDSRVLKANILRNLFTHRQVISSYGAPLSVSDMNYLRRQSFSISSNRILISPKHYEYALFSCIEDYDRAHGVSFDYAHFTDLHFFKDTFGKITSLCHRSASGSVLIDPDTLFVLEGNVRSYSNRFFRDEIRAAYAHRYLYFPIRL